MSGDDEFGGDFNNPGKRDGAGIEGQDNEDQRNGADLSKIHEV